MSNPAKARLVRCPKCGNVLRLLTDYVIYKCGGCGAILRGNKNIESVTSSEKSGDESYIVSDKISKESSNLDFSNRGVKNMSFGSENGVKSNGSSGSTHEIGDDKSVDLDEPKPVIGNNRTGSRRYVTNSNWRYSESDLQEASSSYHTHTTRPAPQEMGIHSELSSIVKIPLQEILLATNDFAKKIASGGYGPVYQGKSENHGMIAVKRLDPKSSQGDVEFRKEIALLSEYKHDNIVSLIGFCDENDEKILVYKLESNGSLDKYLDKKDLSWIQRLRICLDAARGLKYLHDDVGPQQRILHRDVKSANILLDENWNAKISDFGLSRLGPANMHTTLLISNPCGTLGYIDPEYLLTGCLTQKSDVFSFGVVLFEVLCGRPTVVRAYKDERQFLTVMVRKHYKRQTLNKVIHFDIQNQIDATSLLTFSTIAYQCLMTGSERPTMSKVVQQLQIALDNQLNSRQHDMQDKVNVMVNGHPIPDRLVKKAEKLAGPIKPGDYWYDSRAGFWGIMGGPCRGITMPFIEEFNFPMPEKCADGNTNVFVNGRELHQKDLDLLASRGLPTDTDRSYVIEISGRVLDEDSGEELEGLGKLAPTMERMNHGFGMRPL